MASEAKPSGAQASAPSGRPEPSAARQITIRRVPPLAVAIALVAAALIATTWTTRRSVNNAFAEVRDGEAFGVLQAARADLADLGGPPAAEDLAALIHDHQAEGLRYVAMLDSRGRIALESGTAVGVAERRADRKPIQIEHVGNRIRIEMRANFRRAWGEGGRPWWLVMEIDPVRAEELHGVASRNLAIGAIAALVLLGVAAALVRRELRRQGEERARERERRLASLGEMSAVLAHEIRNPLASLKGNAQLLATTLPEGEKSRAKAERVVDEAVRLEKLTQDLLAFVRTGELQRTQVAPATVVVDAAAAVTGDITVETAGAPATWSLDGSRMHEVLVNLLDNAVAAGPPVTATVRGDAGKLVIEICDRGPGVAAGDRERIFEPFFTGKTRGTGLGLAIARRVIELHRGTITVGDAPGGGGRFRIELPEA